MTEKLFFKILIGVVVVIAAGWVVKDYYLKKGSDAKEDADTPQADARMSQKKSSLYDDETWDVDVDVGLPDESLAKEQVGFITYTVNFGDGYLMHFDYLPRLTELELTTFGGVAVQDYCIGTTVITAAHVPSQINQNNGIPRTAEDYIAEDMDSDFSDALPYVNGNTKGYAYWERNKYPFGTAYTSGYNVFYGDEYFYIFVQSMDKWPENIVNVRIEKDGRALWQ